MLSEEERLTVSKVTSTVAVDGKTSGSLWTSLLLS